MSQTLQNQITYAKSMSGIVELSDGAGTTISNGQIITNDLSGNNISSSTFNTTDLTLPRKSTAALNALLGSTIDLDLLIQNLNYNTSTRGFEFWDDQATGQIITVDTSNNGIDMNTINMSILANVLDINSPNLTFTNSTVSFPNSLVSFNDNLPTSTLTSATLGTQFITRAIADGRFGQLAAANTWSSTNTFNSNLPTSTITSATLSTQFITRAIGDGRFGQLAAANTFTSQNIFQNGILPCTTLTQRNIQLGGQNQLQYRQPGSDDNISIGEQTLQGDSDPVGQLNNTGQRNIGIGRFVLKNVDTGSDNIFIGYQAGSGAQYTRLVSVQPSRCIAIGSYSQSALNLYATDAISIGYNSLSNASGPATGNICIGSNVGNGLNFQTQNVLIGNNCAPTVNDNGVLAIGANCMGLATGSFNSGTAVGAAAGYNNAGGQGGCFIGANAGFANTTGNYSTCLGFKAGFSSTPTINDTICIGYNSAAFSDYECVFGGESSTEQVFLTLPKKHRLSCNQSAAVASFNILFRTNENVIINNTVTSINLPTPDVTGVNIGAKFNLLKTTSASNITINAPAGQTIGFINTSGVYATAATYTFTASTNNISVLCIANTGTSWLVINNNNIGFVDLTTNQTIAGIKTFSSPPVMSGASITSNTIPSTSINNTSFVNLTTNQSAGGIKTFTGDIILKKYYLSMFNPTTITAGGTTIGTPLYEYYRVNFAGGTINLPLTVNVEIGTVLRFRKTGNLASAIQVTPNTGQSIYPRNSVTTQTTLTDIMGGGSAYGSVILITATTWAILD